MRTLESIVFSPIFWVVLLIANFTLFVSNLILLADDANWGNGYLAVLNGIGTAISVDMVRKTTK